MCRVSHVSGEVCMYGWAARCLLCLGIRCLFVSWFCELINCGLLFQLLLYRTYVLLLYGNAQPLLCGGLWRVAVLIWCGDDPTLLPFHFAKNNPSAVKYCCIPTNARLLHLHMYADDAG